MLADFWWAHVVPAKHAIAAAATAGPSINSAADGSAAAGGSIFATSAAAPKAGKPGTGLLITDPALAVMAANAAEAHRPAMKHPKTAALIKASKAMASQATATIFPETSAWAAR